MHQVWQHSRAKNDARLVLLALADFADDGGGAYPSVSAIAKKTLLCERAVQAGLKDLVELREVAIKANEARKGCNYYIISITPADSAPPQILHPAKNAPPQILPKTPADSAPEPSVEPSVQEGPSGASAGEKLLPDGSRKSRPDTEQQMIAHCVALGLPPTDGQAIWAKWEGNGFTNDRKLMKNWHQVVRSWQLHGYLPSQRRRTGTGPPGTPTSVSPSAKPVSELRATTI